MCECGRGRERARRSVKRERVSLCSWSLKGGSGCGFVCVCICILLMVCYKLQYYWCVCVHILPHNKDEGKDGDEDDHGEQNQQNRQTHVTFILSCRVWMGRGQRERERYKEEWVRECEWINEISHVVVTRKNMRSGFKHLLHNLSLPLWVCVCVRKR